MTILLGVLLRSMFSFHSHGGRPRPLSARALPLSALPLALALSALRSRSPSLRSLHSHARARAPAPLSAPALSPRFALRSPLVLFARSIYRATMYLRSRSLLVHTMRHTYSPLTHTALRSRARSLGTAHSIRLARSRRAHSPTHRACTYIHVRTYSAVTPCFATATLPNSASRRAAFTCHSAAVSLESARTAESTARREKSRAFDSRP